MRQYFPATFTSKYMPAPSAYLSPMALSVAFTCRTNVSVSAIVAP